MKHSEYQVGQFLLRTDAVQFSHTDTFKKKNGMTIFFFCFVLSLLEFSTKMATSVLFLFNVI